MFQILFPDYIALPGDFIHGMDITFLVKSIIFERPILVGKAVERRKTAISHARDAIAARASSGDVAARVFRCAIMEVASLPIRS
ncbi:hypothetical protein [Novosphingobium sp. BL-52-GroH]|uniref:hypothetical protein n=1 Tax=Novosphingobium sp. BL-52-GroH TaxID=3349877 RepID=UPI00384D3350